MNKFEAWHERTAAIFSVPMSQAGYSMKLADLLNEKFDECEALKKKVAELEEKLYLSEIDTLINDADAFAEVANEEA